MTRASGRTLAATRATGSGRSDEVPSFLHCFHPGIEFVSGGVGGGAISGVPDQDGGVPERVQQIPEETDLQLIFRTLDSFL